MKYEVAHPMLEAHHIAFVVVETASGYQVKNLSAGDEPVAHFTLAEGNSRKPCMSIVTCIDLERRIINI